MQAAEFEVGKGKAGHHTKLTAVHLARIFLFFEGDPTFLKPLFF